MTGIDACLAGCWLHFIPEDSLMGAIFLGISGVGSCSYLELGLTGTLIALIL